MSDLTQLNYEKIQETRHQKAVKEEEVRQQTSAMSNISKSLSRFDCAVNGLTRFFIRGYHDHHTVCKRMLSWHVNFQAKYFEDDWYEFTVDDTSLAQFPTILSDIVWQPELPL